MQSNRANLWAITGRWAIVLLAAMFSGVAVAEVDLPELISSVEPSVLRLEADTPSGTSQGSGFLVEQGVVTNYHVIEGATSVIAVFQDGKKFKVEGLLAHDKDRDIVLLKLTNLDDRPILPLAKVDPRKGESVLTFGAPLGLSWTASDGIVSGIRLGKEIRVELPEYPHSGEAKWIQTTAPISPGNSGGPLVNMKGEVVGVNSWTYRRGQNLNFALSSYEVIDLVSGDLPDKVIAFSEIHPAKLAAGEGGVDAAKLREFLCEVCFGPQFDKNLKKATDELDIARTALEIAYRDEEISATQERSAVEAYKSAKRDLQALSKAEIKIPEFLEDRETQLGTPGKWFVVAVLDEARVLVSKGPSSSAVLCVEGVATAGISPGTYPKFDGLWINIGEIFGVQKSTGLPIPKIRGVDVDLEEVREYFVKEVAAKRIEASLTKAGDPKPPAGDEAAAIAKKRLAFVEARENRIRLAALERKASTKLAMGMQFKGRSPERAAKYFQLVIDEYPETMSAAKARKMLGVDDEGEYRTWKSGNFTTTAKLVGIKGDKAVLSIKGQNRKVEVPIGRLSQGDKDFIELSRSKFE